ncbi:UNVERIFIED_CONTAM: hypothetical protein FKN15_031705 [Acipenser sinensis]
MVCDAKLRILDVLASYPGTAHDSYILRQSGIYAVYETGVFAYYEAEKGTPPTAPPARQGGKAARKTKHLIPIEGEVRSAAGGVLPVAVAGQGTASGSIRGKRKAPARLPTCARKCTRLSLLVGVPGGAIEGPQKRKRPPRHPPSTGIATEVEKAPSPEAVQGSAEEAEPMEEAPAEREKGREEPARAEEALRVDPLPVSKETSDAGPERTIEGPAAAEVAEGAQEGPPKEHLPRAPPSSDGDTGPETCVAEEGAAETAPEAEAGSADKAEPMQATTAEEPEGEEEPSQEQKLPQASLSCGDGGFGPRAAAEGDEEGGEETPPEADGGSVEPAPTMVSEARKGGEEPERAEGGALKADPLPEVQQGQETGPRPSIEGPVPVTKGAREEPPKEQPPVTDVEAGEGPKRVYPLSLGEGGEGPERVDPLPSRAEDGPETVPQPSKEGLRSGTRQSGLAAYAERPSAPPKSRVQTVPVRVPPPVSPAASPGGGARGETVKLKIKRNALTHQRECVVLLHREGGDGEPEEREEDSESTCSVVSESLSAPSPDIPAAELLDFLETTIHRRDKVQLALDKWGDFQRILHSVRSFLRASHASKTSGTYVHIRARKLHDQLVNFGRSQDLP